MPFDLFEIVKAVMNGENAGVEVQKDAVTATALSIGGTLTPAAAARYFTNVTDQSSFLGRVSSDQVVALEQDVDMFSVARRQLQRVAEGSEPTDLTGASNTGGRWALKDVQLFATINFSTIVNRQRQGDIDSYLAGLFSTVFRNDLLLLGLEGDEALTGDDFKKLNDGWPKKARTAVNGTGRDLDTVEQAITIVRHGGVTDGPFQAGETVTGGTSAAEGVVAYVGSGWVELVSVTGTFVAGETATGDTSAASATVTQVEESSLDHMSTMDNMLEAMSDEYLLEGSTAFLMSKKNAMKWGKQMALHDGLNPYLITGNVPSYQGYEVVGIPGMPADTFMLTDPLNLGFGMGMNVQRFRDVVGRKRCIEYTWNLYSDYLLFNGDAVVYADEAE